jgi:hypothetical protein
MNHDGRTSLKRVENEDVLTNCNTPALLVIWQAQQDHEYESTGRLLPFPGPSSLIKLQLGNWLPMQRISFFFVRFGRSHQVMKKDSSHQNNRASCCKGCGCSMITASTLARAAQQYVLK